MSGVASWAVFLDDPGMLDTVRQYFIDGAGNGRLTNYILDSAGQCQESGRDQGHTQLGLFNLVQVSTASPPNVPNPCRFAACLHCCIQTRIKY